MEAAGKALMRLKPQPSNTSPEAEQEKREIAAIIARMLLHFWSPADLSDAARAAMAADWVSDLREFGPEVVAEACSAWRRGHTKRPMPAEIRGLCFRERQERAAASEHLALPPPDAGIRMEERRAFNQRKYQDAFEYRDQCAKQLGFANFGEWMRAGLIEGARRGGRQRQHGDTAAAHGVTATEWKPTPERMARDLAELQARGDVA